MKESEKSSSRARLLDAAGEVFGEVGFKAATIREITRRAGMNVAAVNYYFRDKAELYSAVLQHAQRCAVETVGVGESGGSAEERLRSFIEGMMRHVLDPLQPDWHGRLMAREMAAPTRMPHNLIDEVFRPKVDLLDGILRDLSDERLSDEEIARASASIVSQCLFYRQNRPLISRLYPELLGDKAHIEKLAEHIASFSLGGMQRLKESSPEKLSIAML